MTGDRQPTNNSSYTTRARDAALHRLSRVNRMLITGSIVFTGLLTDVAAHAFPGKTAVKSGSATAARTKSARGQASERTGTSSTSPHATTSSSSEALHPPAQAPQTTSESAPAKESTTAQEATPAKESTSAQESTSAKESAAAQESSQVKESTAKEATQAKESEASREASTPVVSGGS